MTQDDKRISKLRLEVDRKKRAKGRSDTLLYLEASFLAVGTIGPMAVALWSLFRQLI